MLNGIRKAATNWLGRLVLIVIMGVLILSFAIWGIGDMLRVQGATSVASVGGVEIGMEQVRRTYQNSLEELSQRARRRITNDEAKLIGLDKQVMARLITEASLDQRVGVLGLNIPQDDVVASVTSDPTFKGADGKFDSRRLFEMIRQAGLNEPLFLAEQKKSLLRRQLAAGLGGETVPSRTLMDAAYRFVSEQRTINYFLLPATNANDIAAPAEDVLKTYFESRKNDFRAPEYRKITLVSALPAELGVDLTVTDDDLRRVYERGLAAGRFGSPAKRHAQQVLFPTEAEAMAALLRMSGGAHFEAILADRKIKLEDADLGLKTRAEFADPATAEAVFTTEEGGISTPFKTSFGFGLVRVSKIEPGTEIPFETAKASLGDEAKALKLRSDAKIQQRLDEVQKKIEDAKTAGKALAEAAPAAGLVVQTIDAISATGTDKVGAKVNLAGDAETLKAIFQSDIGLDNEAIRLREGGLVWFEIAGVEPARDRPFDEVKAEALLRWRTDEASRLLVEKANGYVKRLEAGEEPGDVARSAGAEILEISVNRREGGAVGPTGAAQAFAVKIGGAASASTIEGGRVVLKVTNTAVTPLDPASGIGVQLSKQLGEQLGEDMVTQYVQRLQSELGANINQRLLQSAIGGGS